MKKPWNIKAGHRYIRHLGISALENKSIDETTRTIWHAVSREVEDRMGDIVRIGGGDFTDFEKKPTVLYGHDYRSMNPIPAIGMNIGFKVEGDRLMAGTRFFPTDDPKMSQAMKDLINDNWFLHSQKALGWSIGFIAKKWEAMMENGNFLGYDIQEWSLLEYSSVIIPANQDALTNAIKGGQISGAILKSFFDLGAGAEAPEGGDVVFDVTQPGGVPRKAKAVKDDPEFPDEDPAAGEPAVVKAAEPATAAAAEPVKKTEPQQQGHEPEPIKDVAPAIAPAPEYQEHNQGGTMLEKIFEKLAKGEQLTAEEQALYDKAKAAFAPPAPAPAPARRLDLVDTMPRGDVRAIRRFYGASPDDDSQKWLADDPKTYSPAEKDLVEFLDDAYIVSSIKRQSPRRLKMWDSFFGRSSALKKAMDTATSGEGSEWIPTLLSANFIEKFRLEAKVAALFDDIPMPSNPFKLPYVGGMSASNFYLVPESISDSPTASPASTMATGDQTLTAKKLKARTLWSDEFDEDSILAVLPILKKELATGGAEAIEDCIINADTTATHQDSDVTDSMDRRKIWNGLRDQCPSGTKVDLGTFATATLLGILTKMGKYGVNPKDLAFITGARGYNYMRNLTETLTVDKYGAQATILNGELGKLAGVPIIVSEYVRENLNATGVYDGSTTDNTIILVVNRRALMLGTRGGVKLTFLGEGQVDQNQLIMSFRKALAYRWTPSSTVTTIGLAYNVAV